LANIRVAGSRPSRAPACLQVDNRGHQTTDCKSVASARSSRGDLVREASPSPVIRITARCRRFTGRLMLPSGDHSPQGRPDDLLQRLQLSVGHWLSFVNERIADIVKTT
jgi:hypothetical protein